jgi:hypothetical protein
MFTGATSPSGSRPVFKAAKKCHVCLAGGLGKILVETDIFMEDSARYLAVLDRYLEYS